MFTMSKKFRPQLVFEGNKFNWSSSTRTDTKWDCSTRRRSKCSRVCYIDRNYGSFVRIVGDHNHAPICSDDSMQLWSWEAILARIDQTSERVDEKAEFKGGRLNSKLLIYQGFSFRRRDTTKTCITWRCSTNESTKCKVTCYTDLKEEKLLKIVHLPHKHRGKDGSVERLEEDDLFEDAVEYSENEQVGNVTSKRPSEEEDQVPSKRLRIPPSASPAEPTDEVVQETDADATLNRIDDRDNWFLGRVFGRIVDFFVESS